MKNKIWSKNLIQRLMLAVFSIYLIALILPAEEKSLTIAAVGDCSFSRRLSPHAEERFLKLMEVIRNTDFAYGNMEGTIHDRKGYPAPKDGGINLVFEPFIADELKWLGFDMMGLANNHSMDFLTEGMLETQKNLERVGIIHAGAGKNLEEASRPAYFDSKNGRLALINCTATFPSWALASASLRDLVGRPGINPLRLNTTFQVTKQDLEILKKISVSLIQLEPGQTTSAREIFNFLNVAKFKAGLKHEILNETDERDVKRTIDSIKDARQQASIVMVSVHAHSLGPYLEKFARDCIDAGADCVLGSGLHRLAGVEIYKNKPIFYSLGNFVLQNDVYNLGQMFKEEVFWDSLVAWIVFSEGNLKELKLYPVSLNFGAQSADLFGRPLLVDEKTGKKIIEQMVVLSAPYGTKMTYEKGIGRVQISQ